MSFKKQLDKKTADSKAMTEYAIASSKSIFLIAAFTFFLNIFLIGGDKNNSFGFLKFILPLSYSFFIASLLFLSLAAIDKFLPEKYLQYKKIIRFTLVAFFLLPTLMFFIQGKTVSSI